MRTSTSRSSSPTATRPSTQTAKGPAAAPGFARSRTASSRPTPLRPEDTRVIAFGVGAGVGNAGSGLNLRSISGSDAQHGLLPDDRLRGRGAPCGPCVGQLPRIGHRRQAGRPSRRARATTGAVPQGGWTFGHWLTGITVRPASRGPRTAPAAANFPLTFAGGTTCGPVTLNETQQAGYTLQQVGGANAVCTRPRHRRRVPVTNSGATGFTVTAAATYPSAALSTTSAPQPLASVVLHKQWVVNGHADPDGAPTAGADRHRDPQRQHRAVGAGAGGFRQGDSVQHQRVHRALRAAAVHR